jgi:hypothetical protein
LTQWHTEMIRNRLIPLTNTVNPATIGTQDADAAETRECSGRVSLSRIG